MEPKWSRIDGKMITFLKQRFRRSFFGSGRMTAPCSTGEARDSAVVLRHWANDCQVQPYATFRWAIDRLIQGERPAIALLLLFVGRIWAVDRLVFG